MNNHEYAIELLRNLRSRAINMKEPDKYGAKFIEGFNEGMDFIVAYVDYCICYESMANKTEMKGGKE